MYQSRSLNSIAASVRPGSRATVTHSIPGSILKPPKWWQRRPILKTAFLTDLQKGSYSASIYALIQSMFQILICLFDLYCLFEARPGSRHFRSFGFSFVFVYAGNPHVRRSLIASAFLLLASVTYLLVASFILMSALKKEQEIKFKHWLRAMAIFIVLRTISLFYQSLVNDLYFGYHQAMLVIWLLLTSCNVFAFLIVYSNYQELSNITKLEDMAKLKMSTLSSLNASRSLSRASLDSYAKGGYGTVNIQPSPNVSVHMGPGSRGGSTTGSISSFNMGGYGTVGQPIGLHTAGRTGATGTTAASSSSHPPSTASSVPLSTFGLNFNPNGVFTIEQLTGSTTSLSRHTPTRSDV